MQEGDQIPSLDSSLRPQGEGSVVLEQQRETSDLDEQSSVPPTTWHHVTNSLTVSVESTLPPFDPVFLRDACSCSKCIDPSTSQKLFETADIPFDLGAKKLVYSQDGDLSVTWQNDVPGYGDHTSVYTKAFLDTNQSLRARIKASHSFLRQTIWDRHKIESDKLTLDYDSYMNSPSTLHSALHHLQRYGLLFLSSVPSKPTSISAIATRIGPLQNTFYGPTWDVRSVPSAKNVAYTSGHLGFHMDLLYMADPPRVQILHCMKASTQGGESLFSDALAAVVPMFRSSKAARIGAMFKFPVTYRYKNDGHWYQYTRPMIEITNLQDTSNSNLGKITSRITAINWSPPFQAPFEIEIGRRRFSAEGEGGGRLRNYLTAAKQFKARVEAKDAIFETRMDEGTCVIFDNRRVLHARRAFSAEGGERWLRGAYVGGDAFMSRLRMLNEEYGPLDDAQPGAGEDV